jgi:hypothetical protein
MKMSSLLTCIDSAAFKLCSPYTIFLKFKLSSYSGLASSNRPSTSRQAAMNVYTYGLYRIMLGLKLRSGISCSSYTVNRAMWYKFGVRVKMRVWFMSWLGLQGWYKGKVTYKLQSKSYYALLCKVWGWYLIRSTFSVSIRDWNGSHG